MKAWRHAAIALGACAGGFVLTTAPVISRYPAMFGLVVRLFFHRGAYGSTAETSVPTPHELAASVARFVTAFWAWHLWAGLVFALTIILLLRRRLDRSRLALTVFALLAIALPYLAAARHLTPRYVIPGGVASILLVGIIAAEMPLTRPQQLVALLCATAVLGVIWRADLMTHDLRNENAARLNAAVRFVVGTQAVYNPVVVYSWRFPAPAYALRVLAPDEDFLRHIERRFPREGDYAPWSKMRLPAGLSRWDFFVIAPQDLPGSPAADGVLVARAGGFLVMRRR
jgi:hypothetical protein